MTNKNTIDMDLQGILNSPPQSLNIVCPGHKKAHAFPFEHAAEGVVDFGRDECGWRFSIYNNGRQISAYFTAPGPKAREVSVKTVTIEVTKEQI